MNASGKHILIIEDDPQICNLLQSGLSEEGFIIQLSNNGEEGLEHFEKSKFDLVILDIMLPGMNGLSVCSALRQKSQVPILLLTALSTSENVALGLDMGADDYLTKPFKFIELIARIKSLLRRSAQFGSTVGSLYYFDDIVINDEQKTVIRGNKQINLTATEYRLLFLLVNNPRKVFSRDEIMEAVWGQDYDMGTNVVDVYINYLRKKLETPQANKIIHTVIGMGYVLREEA